MERKEEYIRGKCGSRTPFRVPEGYFEHFTRQLMEKLPEQTPLTADVPQPVIGRKRYAWRYAAAIVCGMALLSGSLYLTIGSPQQPTATAPLSQSVAESNGKEMTDDAFYEALDYAMVDNQEIAMYLTEAY